jgi:hypothetical protein
MTTSFSWPGWLKKPHATDEAAGMTRAQGQRFPRTQDRATTA